MAQSDYIASIKAVREKLNCGLLIGKKIVDEFKNKGKDPKPEFVDEMIAELTFERMRSIEADQVNETYKRAHRMAAEFSFKYACPFTDYAGRAR